MLEKVRRFIAENQLILPGELVVVGVSGGPDSVALLHLLACLAEQDGFSVHAAYFNHGLRPEAQEEEQFVQELARSLGVESTVGREDVGAKARLTGKSVEEAARDSRYAFYKAVVDKIKADKVATAHHMDDQAETVLMHLLRGSGLKGLGGMSPKRDNIIRPFLVVTRAEILSYLEANRLDYRVDASNYECQYLRNRIRLRLIPLLEKEYNPNIVKSLCQLASLAREENSLLEEITAGAWAQTAREEEEGLVLTQNRLQALPLAIQRRVIFMALKILGGEQGWEMKDVQAVLDLASKQGSDKQVCLGKNIWAQKRYGEMVFRTGPRKSCSFRYLLEIPGKTYIEELGAELVCRLEKPGEQRAGGNCVALDWVKLKKPLEVRSRRPGDRFRPLGLGGTKKLQDFLVDNKVPVEKRDRIGILASGDEIYWVIGFRLDERAAVSKETEQVLVVEIREIQPH